MEETKFLHFFLFFFVGICLLKTVLAKFFSLFMMTFNKSYAIVVWLKQGIEIGRKKKNWSQTRRVKTGQKIAIGFSNNIFCSSGSN